MSIHHERDRADIRLEESERLMAAAQRLAHFGSWEVNLADDGSLDWDSLRWSDEMFRIAGHEPGGFALNREAFLRHVPAEEHELLRRAIAKAIHTHGQFSIAHRLVRPGGEERFIQQTGEICADERTGKPIKVIGAAQDITERKQAEREMHRQSTEMNVLFDLAPASLWFKDTQNRILRVNQRAADGIGKAAREIEGKFTQDVYGEEEAAGYNAAAQEVVRSGTPMLGVVKTWRNLQGEERWIQKDIVPVNDATGRVSGIVVMAQDVTERKQAEEELNRKTAFLEAQVHSSLDAIIVRDQQGRKILQNQRMVELFHIPPEIATTAEEAPQVQWIMDLMKEPEQFAAKVAYLQEQPDEIMRDELELLEGKWLDCYSAPVRGRDGKHYGRIWNFRDITERKQAEEAMRHSVHLLRLITNLVPHGIFAKDAAGRHIFANPALAEWSGLSIEEMIGKTDFDLVADKAEAEAYRADDLAIIQSGRKMVISEEPRTDLSGRTRLLQTIKIPFAAAGTGELAVLGVCTDITERKRAEEDLLGRQTELQALFDLMPAMLCFKDTQNVFLRVNQRLAEAAGKSIAEIEGKSAAEVFPLEADKYYADDLEVIQTGKAKLGIIETLKGRDGNYLWIQTDKVPVCGKDGKVSGIVVMIQDITERKIAEEALRQSEERFRGMFDSAAPGVATSTPHGRYLQTNAAYCRMLGYTEEELLARDFASLTHPEDLMLNLNLRDELLTGKIPSFVMEKRYFKKGGEIIWVRASVSATHGAAGEVTTLIVIAEDITWHKKAREELLESERRFATAFEFAPIGVAIVAPDGRWMKVNRALTEMLGYSEAGFLSSTVRDMTHPEDAQLSWENICRALAEGANSYQCEKRYLHKSGRAIPVLFNVSLVHDSHGQPAHFIAQIQDITEQKRIESRFRRLIDSDAQAVFFFNLNGEVSGANEAFLKLVGHSRAALESGRLNWMRLTPPEYSEHNQRAVRELASTGVCKSFEKEFIRKDGSRVPILLGAAMFEDNPNEGVSFVLDQTERKKMEQQFLRAQRMESIGTLAGGIAHDLNNSLTPILMAIAMLQDRIQDGGSRELLALMESSARHSAELVGQVLSFARGVDGRRILVNPVHILREIQKIVRDTFPKNIHAIFEASEKLPTVTGDPTQLHQVITNLCVNARDAMPAGGVLEVKMETVLLDEVYARMNADSKPGNYVMISVRDTGTGIAPGVRERIFDPFFTTKEVGKGTGLGLSTTMAIVKSHGGFINLYTEMGKGTTFKAYLPANLTALAQSRTAAVKTRLPRGNGELVLVVDDEPGIRAVARETLERFGFRVLAASNGAEAVALYAEHQEKIALVLTDMAMPVMDGASTIIALRTINPKVEIIGSSGLASFESASKSAGTPIKYFVPKPYTAETLLNVIAQALKQRAEGNSSEQPTIYHNPKKNHYPIAG